MLRKLSFCLGMFCVTSLSGFAEEGKPAYETPQAAKEDPDFSVQGEYAAEGQGVQIVALGEGKYRIVKFPGGLPGKGWSGKDRTASEGDAEAVKAATQSLSRVDRQSSTLGAQPPAGASVLFDGTKETLEKHWNGKMTDDGLLMQGCTTKDTFKNFTLHLEFRVPYMPKARGQGRGNSGLYLQGRYECQILDSFGLEEKDNECGGIYSISKPSVNACLPPLTWETYDVEFQAAKFDDTGKKTENGRTTIKLNGVVIHDNLEILHGTPGGTLGSESAAPGPIFLQDHGNPVRFRNIWVVVK